MALTGYGRIDVTEPAAVYAALLTMPQVHAVGAESATTLVGHVAPFTPLQSITRADDIRRAFNAEGLEEFTGPGGTAYLLVFPQAPLMRFANPTTRRGPDRPSFPSGFLRLEHDIAPVWWLELTRVPIGSVVWRLTVDGGQPFGDAAYRGLARGWEGSRGYLPPTGLFGPRARWRGGEFIAAFTADGVEILSPTQHPGTQEVRPGVWQAVVPRGEVDEIFELELAARWHDQAVRVLDSNGGRVRLLLPDPDAAAAAALGASEVSPGVWQVITDRSSLSNVTGVELQVS